MSNTILCGFDMRMIIEQEQTRISHIPKKLPVTSQSGIKLRSDEYIQNVEMDYDEKAIRGIRISTDEQLISLGPIGESDFYAKFDKPDIGWAIIGFQFVFGDDRIVEVSVFSAPLNKKNFSLDAENADRTIKRFHTHALNKGQKKDKSSQDELKQAFKLYRQLKKNQSF